MEARLEAHLQEGSDGEVLDRTKSPGQDTRT